MQRHSGKAQWPERLLLSVARTFCPDADAAVGQLRERPVRRRRVFAQDQLRVPFRCSVSEIRQVNASDTDNTQTHSPTRTRTRWQRIEDKFPLATFFDIS